MSGQFSPLTASFPFHDAPAPRSAPAPSFFRTPAHRSAPAYSIFGPLRSVFRSDPAPLTCSDHEWDAYPAFYFGDVTSKASKRKVGRRGALSQKILIFAMAMLHFLTFDAFSYQSLSVYSRFVQRCIRRVMCVKTFSNPGGGYSPVCLRAQ